MQAFLTDARRGVRAEVRRSGAAVEDAANEWLRYVEHERSVKPATLADYQSAVRTHILPAFGDRRLEACRRPGATRVPDRNPRLLRIARAPTGSSHRSGTGHSVLDLASPLTPRAGAYPSPRDSSSRPDLAFYGNCEVHRPPGPQARVRPAARDSGRVLRSTDTPRHARADSQRVSPTAIGRKSRR